MERLISPAKRDWKKAAIFLEVSSNFLGFRWESNSVT
jgi:hypothetical protein